MTNLLKMAALLCVASLLAGCQLTPEQADALTTTVGNAAAIVDRNADGFITRDEISGSSGNISLWMTGLFGLLGLLGLRKDRQIQTQVDELYDRERELVKEG